MPTLIKIVRGRNKIEFDKGSFDDWCVFLTRPAQNRYAPKDTEYFTILRRLADIHCAIKIFNDFCSFYKDTDTQLNPGILDYISLISDSYGADAEEIDIWFTVIYAGMVAEENKTSTKLRKRIKRLGMHQLLIEDLGADYAAHFSRGKKWQELESIMKARGI